MLDRMTYLCEAVKCFQAPLDFNGRISQSTENKKDDRVALPRLTQRVLSSQGWRFWLSLLHGAHLAALLHMQKAGMSFRAIRTDWCLGIQQQWPSHRQCCLLWVQNLVDPCNWEVEPFCLTVRLSVMVRRSCRLMGWWQCQLSLGWARD